MFVKKNCGSAVNLITVVVAAEENKQIISQCVMVLKSLTEQLSTDYQYLPSLGKVTHSLCYVRLYINFQFNTQFQV